MKEGGKPVKRIRPGSLGKGKRNLGGEKGQVAIL